MTKRVRVGNNLLKNSKYALLSAIEIHNKPVFPYRYEICTLLVINAWELIMKAYIYKYINKKKAIFKNGKDGIYVSFGECLDLITPHISGIKFNHIRESLLNLYEYRNKVSHSYGTDYDIVLFSLLSKNIIFFKNFYEEYFKNSFGDGGDLIILPIGFKNIISPIDFLSNKSNYDHAPKEIQEFIKHIIVSIKSLNDMGIDETILGSFQINFLHTNNTKNADFLARLDPGASIKLDKVKTIQHIHITNDENAEALSFKLTGDPDAQIFSFKTPSEEKKFQSDYYPLTNSQLKKAIKEKYPYKYRAGIVDEIKKYRSDINYSFACRGEQQFKYSTKLIDIIGSSFPDNPKLEHLKVLDTK